MGILTHQHRAAVLEMSKTDMTLQEIADKLGITIVMVRALQMSIYMDGGDR